MKRGLHFIIALAVMLLIVYLQPVFFPSQAQPKSVSNPNNTVIKDKKFVQGELSSSGMSQYIGKKMDSFLEAFGEPIEIQEVNEQVAWWIFGESSADYFQLLIKDNVIQSIFVLGTEVACDSFKIGMTLNDISSVTTLYSNFSFTSKDEDYVVELTEKHLSSQPLVAFDNDAFAILHIDNMTGKLGAVRYVNSRSLLALMPYHLQKGQLPEVNELDVKSEPDYIVQQERQFYSIINTIRERSLRDYFVIDADLSIKSQNILKRFLAHKKDYLSENRLEELEKAEKIQSYEGSFYLNSSEMSELLKQGDEPITVDSSLLYTPTKDVPFMVMHWLSELPKDFPINPVEQQKIGLDFQEQYVMILMETIDENKSSQSDEEVE